ncbi:MAG TPA: nucleotide exchange factor GrpE [Candidatus Babeliales bacterium]|nr:nucleotide exchange factor GrpE [Candidatus Babeliales bacterium]
MHNERETELDNAEAAAIDVTTAAPTTDALAVAQNEVQQLKNSLARVSADFENYKRRIGKDQLTWRQSSQIEIFMALLSTVDDFEQAFLQYEAGKNPELDQWITGFKMIHQSFHDLLTKFNIKVIDASMPFNPEYHEAIAQVAAAQPSGTIVTVHQKGFVLGDRVLRPAKVTVAQ